MDIFCTENIVQSDKTKRSYHSNLKLQFAGNELPKDVSRLIPRSTRHGWKGKQIDSFWGPLPISQQSNEALILRLQSQNKLLRRQLKSLFLLVLLYQELYAVLSVKTTEIQKVSKRVIQLLIQSKGICFDEALWRYLPFTYKQWSCVNRQRPCTQSLYNRCRKQNPLQLSVKEQQAIATACSDKKYQHWPLCSIYYQILREQKISCSKTINIFNEKLGIKA